MTVEIIALIVLLVCFAFIKSTILLPPGKGEKWRPAKLNLLWSVLCIALCFMPYVKWVVMVGSPVVTIFWMCTSGFDRFSDIVVSDNSLIGKILLFKI